jgi:hypothetical protein
VYRMRYHTEFPAAGPGGGTRQPGKKLFQVVLPEGACYNGSTGQSIAVEPRGTDVSCA